MCVCVCVINSPVNLDLWVKDMYFYLNKTVNLYILWRVCVEPGAHLGLVDSRGIVDQCDIDSLEKES